MKTPATKLERAVLRIMRQNADKASDYTIEEVYKDLQYGGCASGTISGMIYYRETLPFFQKHKADINALLVEQLAESGQSIDTLFFEKWDSEDPLALDTTNQNLLAWFGFEEAARRMFDED
jgi:hypothetical protein